MPRLPRIAFDGVICHIVQRGNNRQAIFKHGEDFMKFRNLIKKYKEKYPFNLFNYCLMPTHIHLLLKIIKKEHMAKIFQGLFQSFQFHHRRTYGYVGSLYQNRYKSISVKDDSYLLDCARCIERNPLKAKLVASLDQFKWSSYPFYAFGKKDPLITPNPMYLALANTPQKRKKLYIKYVSQDRPYEVLLDKAIEKLR